MILITPITVNSGNLTSTIPEPDAAQGEVEWSAGAYNLGDRVIKSSTNSVYEVVADPSTTDDPEVGVNKDPATWVYVSPTNKYKMFDTANNSQSIGDNIVVSVTPTDLINSVACFNVEADEITVKAYDDLNVEIYSSSINMRERPSVDGWYNYFYGGFEITDRFFLLDIPPVTTGRVEITFTGSDAKVGTCIFGKQQVLGDAQYGSGAEVIDFSNVNEDQFGNISYTGGFSARLVNYDIISDKGSVDTVFTKIQRLGKKPAVFIGDQTGSSNTLLVYGFVRDFNTVYTWPTKSKIKLTVRGLV